MPWTKSAKKRNKQNAIRRLHNRAIRSELRTQMKKVLVAVRDGNAEAAQAELKLAYKKLDKCAVRRYLHPNTASRYKARLTRRVQSIGA